MSIDKKPAPAQADGSTMSFEDYAAAVGEAQWHNHDWRIGQTYFNVLQAVRPDLAEEVRATAFDPFYEASPVNFLHWLAERW